MQNIQIVLALCIFESEIGLSDIVLLTLPYLTCGVDACTKADTQR